MRAAVGGVQALLKVSRALSLLGGVGLGVNLLGHHGALYVASRGSTGNTRHGITH